MHRGTPGLVLALWLWEVLMCSALLSFQAVCLETASLKSLSSVKEGQTAGRDEQLRDGALVSMQMS